MKKIIIIISSIILIIFLSLFIIIYDKKTKPIINNSEVTLSKCVDGDTAYFINEGKKESYRFIGIDTPEKDDDLGKESSNYTCEQLSNAKKINIKYDSVGHTQDKYGRNLVWVFIDDELLQSKILKQGYGKVKYIYANYEYLKKIYISQNEAIENKIGIWHNYNEIKYNTYYSVIFNYNNNTKTIKVLKNNVIDVIDNPQKEGCRFLGWEYGNYLFDLSTKINKDYSLKASYKC